MRLWLAGQDSDLLLQNLPGGLGCMQNPMHLFNLRVTRPLSPTSSQPFRRNLPCLACPVFLSCKSMQHTSLLSATACPDRATLSSKHHQIESAFSSTSPALTTRRNNLISAAQSYIRHPRHFTTLPQASPTSPCTIPDSRTTIQSLQGVPKVLTKKLARFSCFLAGAIATRHLGTH